MKTEEWVTIATYETPEEAHLASSHLEEEGIQAVLDNETTAGMLWQLSPATGGVKVRVHESNADRARRILVPHHAHDGHHADDETWYCGKCHEEVDEDFDLCWSCGQPREKVAIHRPITSRPKAAAPSKDAIAKADEIEAKTSRALRAAVVGLFLFPPVLNLYSLWLLLTVPSTAPGVDNRVSTHRTIAFAFNLFGLLIGLLLWSTFLG